MLQTIPARTGKAAFVAKGQQVEVINMKVITTTARTTPINGPACRPTEAHCEILG